MSVREDLTRVKVAPQSRATEKRRMWARVLREMVSFLWKRFEGAVLIAETPVNEVVEWGSYGCWLREWAQAL